MEKDYKREIEEIIGGMTCPKDFLCYKSGLDSLCKTTYFGLDKYLECLEENPTECKFSLLNEDKYICQCPLRVYIAEKLGK